MDIKKMSTKNFSVYGKILSSESFAAVPEGEEFSWEDITGDLRLVSPSCTGQLNCRYRDKVLHKMGESCQDTRDNGCPAWRFSPLRCPGWCREAGT